MAVLLGVLQEESGLVQGTRMKFCLHCHSGPVLFLMRSIVSMEGVWSVSFPSLPSRRAACTPLPTLLLQIASHTVITFCLSSSYQSLSCLAPQLDNSKQCEGGTVATCDLSEASVPGAPIPCTGRQGHIAAGLSCFKFRQRRAPPRIYGLIKISV